MVSQTEAVGTPPIGMFHNEARLTSPSCTHFFPWLMEMSTLVRVALDGMALRRQGRGPARVLQHVLPLLADDPRLDCVILSTEEGRELFDFRSAEFHVAPSMTQSAWEQFGLPWHARRVRADVIYSLAECGPAWGPPLVLHVPEDPFVRWNGAKADSSRELIRRAYQRLTIRRGLHHASFLATCSSVCSAELEDRFRRHVAGIGVIPLGVDPDLFRPNLSGIGGESIFHLSSIEARDMSTLVVRAYARALALAPDLPDLFIGGNLGRSMSAFAMLLARPESIGDFTFSGGSRMKSCARVMQTLQSAFSPRCTRDSVYSP